MKKIFTLLIALCISMGVWAQEFNVDGINYFVTDATELTAAVVQGDYRSLEDITIPENVEYDSKNYTVTSIEHYAFNGFLIIKSITLPNTLINIGEAAFEDCQLLTSFTIPSSVKNIGNRAFGNCHRLSNVIVEAPAPPTIGNDVFDTNIAIITIPEGSKALYEATNWNNYTLKYAGEIAVGERFRATNLGVEMQYKVISVSPFEAEVIGVSGEFSGENIVIPALVNWSNKDFAVTTIGSIGVANSGYDRTFTVTLPNSISHIKPEAFNSSDIGISSIIIDEANDYYSFDNGVLYNKNKTTLITYLDSNTNAEFTIPNSVTRIEDGAFSKWDLTTLTIPASVEYIGSNALSYIGNIISQRATPATLGENAFGYYEGSRTNTVPNEAAKAAYSIAEQWKELTTRTPNEITLGLKQTVNNSIYEVINITPMQVELIENTLTAGVLDIPATIQIGTNTLDVTSINSEAFEDNANITEINIPASLINFNGIAGALGVNAINIDANHPEFSSIDGILYDKAKTTLAQCPQGRSGTVNIPNTVYSISAFAFAACSKLENINIPSSVVSIGFNALDGSKWYENLYDNHPDGEVYVGNVLYDYKGTVPANYHLIIKDGTVGVADDIAINSNAIGMSSIVDVTTPNSLVYIGTEFLTNTLWYNNLPEGMNYLGNIAYKYKGNIATNETFTIKNGTIGIAGDCFEEQDNLSSLVIPSSVAYIGRAFNGCTNLTNLTCSASTPPAIVDYNAFIVSVSWDMNDNYTFTSLTTQATLTVPQGSVNAYKAAAQWKAFETITDGTPTNIEVPQATQPFTQQSNKLIFAQDTNIAVYSLSGACVYKGTTQSYTLPQKGMFIVVSNGNAFKVVF